MAPGKPYIHKMDANELAELKNDSPGIVIYWLAHGRDTHNNPIYARYPAKVLAAFSDAFGDNPRSADFIGWQKEGVVKVVLDWMLSCCDGDGLKQVKDIDIKLEGMISSGKDGEFSRFFKTAYLFDFAQEYKIKHLEDKLKRELEFQAKGKFPLRFEEIYDMANYFYHPNRDQTAMDLMIDSIAKGYVKHTLRPEHAYNDELAIWATTVKCDCPAEKIQDVHICHHDDLPEKIEKRVTYFKDPENAGELDEEFGKKIVEDTSVGDDVGGGQWNNGGDGGWNNGADGFVQPNVSNIPGDWAKDGGAGDAFDQLDEANKEHQVPGGKSWADETTEAADITFGATGGLNGW